MARLLHYCRSISKRNTISYKKAGEQVIQAQKEKSETKKNSPVNHIMEESSVKRNTQVTRAQKRACEILYFQYLHTH